MLYVQKVPNLKSKSIDSFKNKIKSRIEPQILYLDNKLNNECDFEESDCYENAKKIKEKKECGEIVYGWMLWEKIPEVLYEGVAHAVYKSIDNRLYDVTPQALFDIVLFFEDKNFVYENKQVDNIYINLSSDKLIDEYINLQKQLFRKTNEGKLENVVGFITEDDVDEKWIQEYQTIDLNTKEVIHKINSKYPVQNNL